MTETKFPKDSTPLFDLANFLIALSNGVTFDELPNNVKPMENILCMLDPGLPLENFGMVGRTLIWLHATINHVNKLHANTKSRNTN